jgi:hypothetical protein
VSRFFANFSSDTTSKWKNKLGRTFYFMLVYRGTQDIQTQHKMVKSRRLTKQQYRYYVSNGRSRWHSINNKRANWALAWFEQWDSRWWLRWWRPSKAKHGARSFCKRWCSLCHKDNNVKNRERKMRSVKGNGHNTQKMTTYHFILHDLVSGLRSWWGRMSWPHSTCHFY